VAAAIRVHVRYFNLVRELTGSSAEDISLEVGATLGELLETLKAAYGPRFAEFLFSDKGSLNSHVRLFLNNKALINAPLSEVLTDGDTLSVFSAVAGG
jgi:MoaD family protein